MIAKGAGLIALRLFCSMIKASCALVAERVIGVRPRFCDFSIGGRTTRSRAYLDLINARNSRDAEIKFEGGEQSHSCALGDLECSRIARSEA